MIPAPYDLIIGLDRADKKADLCLLETATGQLSLAEFCPVPSAGVAAKLARAI